MCFHGRRDMPQPFDTDDPLNRRWRSAVLWTIHDLRRSTATRRPLSLPNLCRLFENRWHRACPEQQWAWGLEAGKFVLGWVIQDKRLYSG
jgi:hypothetical protein